MLSLEEKRRGNVIGPPQGAARARALSYFPDDGRLCAGEAVGEGCECVIAAEENT